tara:strand:- start:17550 stop:17777 length:228 start_codon:yes stop_codon:yes gene_type:complete
MQIMRVVELDLISEKQRCEFLIEETINNLTMDPSDKIGRLRELLTKQTEIVGSLQLWTSYIQGIESSNNNNSEKK